MKDIQDIQVTLSRMTDLVRLGGFSDWASALEKYKVEIAREPIETAGRLLSMYGGMGSLNDLVIYRNGSPSINENNELDALRSRLYELCHA